MVKKTTPESTGWSGKWASVLKHEVIFSKDVVPTGSIGLDFALQSGGVPYGSIFRLWGTGNVGKSTIAQRMCSYVLAQNQKVVWIDSETSFSTKVALANGLDINDPNFGIWRYDPDEKEKPLNVENSLIAMYEWIEAGVKLIIIDSWDALLPSRLIESDPGQGSYGVRAAILSVEFPKLKGFAVARGCTIVFVQQVRDIIGGPAFGPTQKPSGGNTLNQGSTHEVQLQSIKKEKLGDTGVVNRRVRATVIRNKSSGSDTTAEFDLRTDIGISWQDDLIEYGVLYDLIDKGGAGWYTFKDLQTADGTEAKFHGQEAARVWLCSNIDHCIALDQEIRRKALGK